MSWSAAVKAAVAPLISLALISYNSTTSSRRRFIRFSGTSAWMILSHTAIVCAVSSNNGVKRLFFLI